MRLLISDTNVLIDFEVGGLLDELFRLDAVLAVPDVILEEELGDLGHALMEQGLVRLSLGADAVLRAARLAAVHRRVGRNDLLALALAEQEACMLLTGDSALRTLAESEGVEVRGSLWVAEQLARQRLVGRARLEQAFRRMEAGGRRLPWTLVWQRWRRS
ncbi:MAG: DUF3368 domain-containing protein [Acidobacteria bacterium]|nr:DUF3368 domain-containing protein [Acidobacteriota bacterium]